MALYLLDSNAVIDYFLGIPASVAMVDALYDEGHFLCVCDVVVAEVFSGLNPRDRERSQRFIERCRFLETDLEAAVLAGEWRYAYSREGISLTTTDVLIAATAYFHRATLVTANLRHFTMPEVTVLPLPRAGRT